MRGFFCFVLGAATGAIVALLIAPESGRELRTKIRATADKELAELQSEWHTAMTKTQERLTQMQTDLDAAPSKAQSEEVAADAGQVEASG